jgi:hypothetical protein
VTLPQLIVEFSKTLFAENVVVTLLTFDYCTLLFTYATELVIVLNEKKLDQYL